MRYKDCVEYIRSDYFRVTGRNGDGMFRMSLKGILDTGFRFLFWFRLAKCDNLLVGGWRGCCIDVSPSVTILL